MDVFEVSFNPFNGAEVTHTGKPIHKDSIHNLLVAMRDLQKHLIWLTISIEHAYAVPLLTDMGFVFHNCQEQELTLIHRLKDDALAPFVPTHTVGVGGLVQRANGDVLLIRDRMMNGKGLKLPGGYVDPGEGIEQAVEREVLEETGIYAKFNSIVGMVSKHPHQYNKTNLYIICLLNPQTDDINIQDTMEIETALWIPVETFLADDDNSRFHQHLVQKLLQKDGLKKDSFTFEFQANAKHEMFLIQES
jgi:ADP-ribose pyrophosphatase YjhB (NUDIX family)